MGIFIFVLDFRLKSKNPIKCKGSTDKESKPLCSNFESQMPDFELYFR